MLGRGGVVFEMIKVVVHAFQSALRALEDFGRIEITQFRTVNLTITAVHSRSPKETWISFSTRQGEGTALWAGGLLLAEKGRVYGVEWDIEIPLEASMVSTEPAAHSSGFSVLGQDTLVRAILESLDEDGVGCLRIAGDCLILVETHLDASSVGKGISVRLTPSQLRVTPLGAYSRAR